MTLFLLYIFVLCCIFKIQYIEDIIGGIHGSFLCKIRTKVYPEI